MIQKNEEKGKKISKPVTKIASFKKFSEMKKKPGKNVNEDDFSLPINVDKNPPMNPNLSSDTRKKESPENTNSMMPVKNKEDEELHPLDTPKTLKINKKNEQVKLIGKVAKLPNNTKASAGYNFLNNVKISKNSIWYILVEKQQNNDGTNTELQMVKYNYKEGVNLVSFVNDLKKYYLSKISDPNMTKVIESIKIEGSDKFSVIKNIPLVEIDGKKMITKITEDLIKLLSK